MKLLIVEDNVSLLESMKRMLASGVRISWEASETNCVCLSHAALIGFNARSANTSPASTASRLASAQPAIVMIISLWSMSTSPSICARNWIFTSSFCIMPFTVYVRK